MKTIFYRICLILLLIDCLALAGWIFLRRAIHHVQRPAHVQSHSVMTLNNKHMLFKAHGCWVLRYSAMNCHYCLKMFTPNWFYLERSLDALKCKSYEIAPNGFDIVLDGDTNPKIILSAVTPAFAAQTQFYRTPTTEVGMNHRVIWRQAGVFSMNEARHCIRLVQNAMNHR